VKFWTLARDAINNPKNTAIKIGAIFCIKVNPKFEKISDYYEIWFHLQRTDCVTAS
jgi:hypothetical protein